jgi:hypothetical protein
MEQRPCHSGPNCPCHSGPNSRCPRVPGPLMTHGPLSTAQVRAALGAYNTALTDDSTHLEPMTWAALMTWANIHDILTSPYLGRLSTLPRGPAPGRHPCLATVLM